MASGKILTFFALLLYILVTLMPDVYWQNLILTPHLIAYPFVLWWQGGLILMVVLFLLRLFPQERPFYLLGKGIDRWILGLIGVVFLNCLFAQFKPQALWQAGICLAFITIGYCLWQQLKISHNPIGLLKLQALLQVIYIIESLGLWISQKLLPHWQHLQALQKGGILRNFDPNRIELHNALPSGDSNYVAGYVILALPLLFTLALVEKNFWRHLGIWGFILGLVNIYFTSSFPGFIGLVVMVFGALVIFLTRSRLTFGSIVIGVSLISIVGFGNNYFRSILLGRERGEFFYRTITNAVGIGIGKAHWLMGAGMGSTPLLYQKFRPPWALDQAEMDFQIHSVPLQIFSELGTIGLGILLWGGFLILQLLLPTKSHHRQFSDCLIISILAYIPLAIWDYQIDVLAISISLVIYVVVLIYLGDFREKDVIFPPKYRKFVSLLGWMVLLTGLVWVAPIDRAWQLSSRAFFHLQEYHNLSTIDAKNQAFTKFETNLNRSLTLAPWQPYYSNQLGWNLGEKGWHEPDQSLAEKYQNNALEILAKSIKANPNQEFSYHQSAWLLQNLGRSAEPLFQQALAILPTKPSLNFGLGLSLIQQGKNDLGIQSIVTECFYHPWFITSPLWRNQQLQGLYPTVMTELTKLYQTNKNDFNLAVLNWWLGRPNAVKELRAVNQPLTDFLANLIEDKREELQTMIDRPQSPREKLVSAWYNPSKRRELLRQAWIDRTELLAETEIQPIVDALTARMDSSTNFDQFLREPLPLFTALNLKQFRQRQGFGVMSRHIDGPDPYDLFVIEENAIFVKFWLDLFPPNYDPIGNTKRLNTR